MCRRFRQPSRIAAALVGATAALLGTAPAAAAEAAGPGAGATLTNIAQVLSLGNERLRSQPAPVRLRAVCTASQPEARRVFLQDGDQPIIVMHSNRVDHLRAGDVVEASGTAVSAPGRPRILSESLDVLDRAPMPEPVPIQAPGLPDDAEIGRYVSATGCVRDVLWENQYLILLLRFGNSLFRAYAPMADDRRLPAGLIDAEVGFRGAAVPYLNALGAIQGFSYAAMSTNDFKVLRAGRTGLFDLPLETIAQVLSRPVDDRVRRRIAGTVLGYVPTLDVAYLQDETGVARVGFVPLLPKGVGPALELDHEPQTRPEVGERIEVIGGPFGNTRTRLFLLDCELRRIGRAPDPPAVRIDVAQLRSEAFGHRLITMTARVISHQVLHFGPRDQQIWMVESEGQVFQVRQEDGFAAASYPPGAWVRFTGIHEITSWRTPKSGDYLIFLRRNSDMEVVPNPPFWTQPEYLQPMRAAAVVACVAAGGIFLQRQKTRRVQASEQRLAALIDNSFDATVVVGTDGRIKYLSPAGVGLFGALGAARSGAFPTLAEVIHPEDRDRFTALQREVLQAPGATRRIAGCRIRRASDGAVRHAEGVVTHCLRVPGVEGVVVNLRDITERTVADAAAKRSEEITRTVHHFATSLLECDTEDEVLWDLARNCIARLGFVDCVVYLLSADRSRLVQRAAMGPKSPVGRTILNPITLRIGDGIVGSAAASGSPEVVHDTRLDPRYIVDDQRRLSEIAVPITADGRVIGVIDSEHPDPGFFTRDHLNTLSAIASLCANKLVRIRAAQELRDLNARLEQHVAERTAALRESEERFSKAFRASPTMLSIVRLPSGEHIDVNDAFLSAFGFDRGEVLGLNAFEIGLWRDPKDGAAMVRALADGRPVRQQELLFHTKAGETRVVMQSAEFVEVGEDRCAILVGQDVTERKRADEELHRALERERELNQLKTSFVSMVSHEFRTPLEVILSSNNILDRYFDRLAPDQRQAQLRAIRKSVRRMSDLLDDVLLLGRMDAGRLEFHPAAVRLEPLCRRIAADAESAAGCDGRVRFAAEGVDAEALADESLLQHILSNLIGNALKYSSADSPVDFIVRRRGDDAEFVVRDYGRGIPKADQAGLFTAFHRGSNVGQTPGNGLGLVIVRRCVDSHRGSLRLDTAQGVGATFTVTLPLYGPGDGPAPSRRPVWDPAAGGTTPPP